MRGTALVLCLVLGLTRANLAQVRSPSVIESDGSPVPTNCAEVHLTWGSFRPYVGDNSHPANCSRFWRCNPPVDGQQIASLYECPPCNPDNHHCHGQPSLMFNIEKKNCDYPEDVTDFFVSGPCGCDKCKACGGVGGTDKELCNLWMPDRPDSCHFCNEDKKCKPGCLENRQCPGELECKNYECVAPCNPDGDTCSKDDAASCDVCSTCQATVSWSCSRPTECCADNPCDDCYDCINGNCEPKECGVCNSCVNNVCEPMDCGECGICKDDDCEDCSDLCPVCSKCEDRKCLEPTTCCAEKPCGPCEDCVDGTCVKRDCGLCSYCDLLNDKCVPKDCGNCKDCDIETGDCEDRDCGVCNCCDDETDECKPKDCGECGICKDDDCEDCSDLCPICSKCEDGGCLDPTECCDENPCGPCQDCVDGTCVDRDCGLCSNCNRRTDKCEPKDCGDCKDCNIDTGDCEDRDCGVCSCCEEDECKQKDCGECGICQDDVCVDCSELCTTCSKCENEKCQTPTECCDEKPCGSCQDCVDGTCVDRDCGLCSNCNQGTDKCEPKDCGDCKDCNIENGDCEDRDCGVCSCCEEDECKQKDCGDCGICQDDVCVDCSELCPTCSKCEDEKCQTPTECCNEKPCGSCQDCVDGTCVDRDCGLCSNCNQGTDKCEPKDCGDCKDCNIETGSCEYRDCGVCSCCKEDKCVPKDCGDCGICKEDVCVDCSELCPACSLCEDEKCLPPTECCAEKPCGPCQTCDVDGNCVKIDCGGCGTCNPDTNECEKDEDQCKPNCGEPDCEICVGVPGKSTFECEHVCADDDEGCCCVDDDCTNYCEADGMVPTCDCEQNKCQCIQTGKIVVKKIIVCTEKCEGCDDDKKVEKMVLNLIGETKKTGKPECKTAALPINKDKCVEFGKEADQNICAGCYQYPLEGDIDEDSTIEWKGEGTWSGTFCVTWYPTDNMDVKCKVEDGKVTDCDEVCDCMNEGLTRCPNKVSSKSRKTDGIMGWFN